MMHTTERKKICVLIPCYNEEEGIHGVITSFPREKLSVLGYDCDVIVIDNNSADDTAAVAREAGAIVLHESKKGKGNAIRLGFRSVPDDADYIVMIDGDGTYRPEEIMRIVEPLDSGFCDVVIGSRLGGRITDGSMRTFNRLGNWFFTFLVRIVYRINVTDVLTGYFAWTHKALRELRPHLESEGFTIEMEMITKMARLGQTVYSVPVTYDTRQGESNLRPIADGTRILITFLKSLFWRSRREMTSGEPIGSSA